MNKLKQIHNIVSSIVLADAMRTMKNEFLVTIRGYLRMKETDEKLFTKVEHAVRQTMESVLSETDEKMACPHCGCEGIDIDLLEKETIKTSNGLYLAFKGVCEHCKTPYRIVFRSLGAYLPDENEIRL